ncbi:MAG: hypothetical protein JWO79_2894 [Actinomycetia bacterium]|nr:hypothetical protein [Actinomycetes bacterium]
MKCLKWAILCGVTEHNSPPGGHWGAPAPPPEDGEQDGEHGLGMTIPGIVNPEPPSPDPLFTAVTSAVPEPHSHARRAPAPFYWALGTAVVVVLAAAGFLVLRTLREPSRTGGSGVTILSTPGASPGAARASSPGASPSPSPSPRISPSGAPYSYVLPAGFLQIPIPNSTIAGQHGVFETAIATPQATGEDLIAVSVYKLGADSDAFSFDQLQAEIDPLTAKVATNPGTAQKVRAAGRRALRYVFDYGSTKVVSYFVFSGRIEIQVRCQWTLEQKPIAAGCTTVVNTLQITN